MKFVKLAAVAVAAVLGMAYAVSRWTAEWDRLLYGFTDED